MLNLLIEIDLDIPNMGGIKIDDNCISLEKN